MRKLSASIAVVLMFIASAVGHESWAITYNYSGTCTTACDEIGLTAGDAVSGSISFLDSELVAGSPYPAPSSFSLHFGSVEITDATADSFGLLAFPPPPFPGLAGPAIVPADLTSFTADLHTGEDPQPPATAADGIIIAPSGPWFATPEGNCNDAECHFLFVRGDFAEGSGAWSSSPVSVPEPATAWLLLLGLFGVLCWRNAQ